MTFLSALILGLVASAHCAGMCGGLQMAMQGGPANEVSLRSRQQALVHLLLLNVGRVTTYVAAGYVFAALGYAVFDGLNIADISRWLRIFTGCVVFLIGAQLSIGQLRPFQFAEPIGAALWQGMSKLIRNNSQRMHHSFISGIAWGFLPCGLVYSVLLATIFADNTRAAATTMLGFGLGTMPSLILTGIFYTRFKAVVSSSAVQTAGGVFFMLGGLMILSAPYWVSTEFMRHYPQLLNLAFCIS